MVGRVLARVVAALAISAVLVPAPGNARALDPLSPHELEKRRSELQHARLHAQPLEKEDGEHGDCAKLLVSLLVSDPKNPATSRTFDLSVILPTEFDGPSPVMILVPTIEGVTVVENRFASNFCNMHVATIIADVNDNTAPKEYPAWGIEDVRNRMAILAIRTVIDYAKLSPHFQHDKVGIMGASLGGIVTSFLAGLESERLAAVVTVVAGGNIPFILSKSENGRVAEIREKRMQATGIQTPEQYEDKLRTTVRFDPLYFAKAGRADRMLMVMSSGDNKVPSEMQLELHHAFGKPVHSMYKVGHVGTIMGLAFMHFDTVGKFISEKMALPHVYVPFTPVPMPEVPKELRDLE